MPTMKPVSNHDYYQCKRCYGASGMDLASLTDFYLPLIGTDAYGVFLALIREGDSTYLHESLFRLLGLTPGEFENALNALEAVGLVRTFVKNEGAQTLFVYCLYAPLHAAEFNGDIMLSGTLKGKLGEETYERLLARHNGDEAVTDMEEVSASFPSYFTKTFDAKYYLGAGKNSRIDGKATVKTGFDRVAFLEKLSELGLRKNALSEEEILIIEKIATLYSLNESTIAEIVFPTLKVNAPVGKKVDRELVAKMAAQAMPFGYLKEEPGESSHVDSDTILAQKVKMMDSMPPARWLSVLQKGHKPASSDLKLVEHLLIDIGLPAPCVNALLEYVLVKNDNVLSAAYCEKIAAAMVREGCKSARDAMDYLMRASRKRRKPRPVVTQEPVKETPKKPMAKEEGTEYVSDEEVDAALADLFKE